MSKIEIRQKITPFLWFDGKAEAAMNLYTSLFPNSFITTLKKWGPGTPFPEDQVHMGVFELSGVQFCAFDAGPEFQFNESISFFVSCENQEEVDFYWEKLTANGGKESQCGWLKDPFGVSWQIVPEAFNQMMHSEDKAATGRVFQALMGMRKIDLAALEAAFNKND